MRPKRPIYTVPLCRIRQAYDKLTTSLRHVLDHLRVNDIFTYKIKYAKVCTGIYGAKVLTSGKKIFQLSCALKKLSNKMFFALIRSVLFEKVLMRISQPQVRPPFWRKNTSSHPLLSRNLSQNTSFSIDFGYSWLRLSQRFKTCFKILRHFFWRKQQS